ncbi:MAG: hypothetical protein U5K30_15455 [Acidimicrobiales bacterium]|nr:hypothetical protein [Acidimicrobiales bacterium]
MSTLADDPTTIGPAPSDPASLGTRAGASEDEPITSPTPVLDLADGHLHVSLRRGVTIVDLDGGLDNALAQRVVPAIAEAATSAEAIIVNLDRATLLDHSALETICGALPDPGDGVDRCLVAGRLSSRLVLERWGIPTRFIVFTSVPDALQAREFATQGYGTGWDVHPGGRDR